MSKLAFIVGRLAMSSRFRFDAESGEARRYNRNITQHRVLRCPGGDLERLRFPVERSLGAVFPSLLGLFLSTGVCGGRLVPWARGARQGTPANRSRRRGWPPLRGQALQGVAARWAGSLGPDPCRGAEPARRRVYRTDVCLPL